VLLLLLLLGPAVVVLRAYRNPMPLGPRKYFLLVPACKANISAAREKL
jgi:hypothetical protein